MYCKNVLLIKVRMSFWVLIVTCMSYSNNKIIAKNNSNINIIIVNLLSETSNNFLSIDAELEESSKIKATIIDFEEKTV